MESRFKRVLKKNKTYLMEKLDVEYGLLPRLSDSGILSDWHTSDIQGQAHKFAKRAKLLDILMDCDDGKFDDFIQALRETSQLDVVNRLTIVDDANLKTPIQQE